MHTLRNEYDTVAFRWSQKEFLSTSDTPPSAFDDQRIRSVVKSHDDDAVQYAQYAVEEVARRNVATGHNRHPKHTGT
jgi:hypothetical protein